MPSVHRRKGSPYWHAAFYLPDGRRTLRSTGTAHKAIALEICLKWAKTSRLAGDGRLTDIRARQIIADIYEIANAEALPCESTEEFLKGWLKKKRMEVADRTLVEYKRIVKEFLKHIGIKAKKPMDTITSRDASKYRTHLHGNVSGSTVNKALRTLRSAWAQALKDSVVRDNVFSKVDFTKEDEGKRRAFTLDELKLILKDATDEWRGMILVGFYTGQRLGDIARLEWRNVDLEQEQIRLVTEKTKRFMTIPIPLPLLRYLVGLPSTDSPETPLFPQAHGRPSSTLSHQFTALLAKVDLAEKVSHHKGTEKGRGARRNTSSLSFHCLRHTTTSVLKNEGVSNAIAMELIGHDSEAVSRTYTHIETSALKKAIGKLPDLMSG